MPQSRDMQHSEPETPEEKSGWVSRAGLIAGPLAALALFLLPAPSGLEAAGWATAAIALWMAIWWVSEAVPLAATALLPLAAFPLLGIAPIAMAAAPYANPIIFLFLGGFWMALAMQRAGLHRRIALAIIARAGGRPRLLIAGVMAATAFLSMWVSNTATAMMMLPIALSLIEGAKKEGEAESAGRAAFAKAMMLGIAYAASIGGLGTLVGSPPNALAAGYLSQNHGIDIGFAAWMAVGVPAVLVLLPLAWLTLTRLAFQVPAREAGESAGEGAALIGQMRRALGAMRPAEKRVGTVLALIAFLWIAHPWLSAFLPLEGISDAGIAIAGALALFLLPNGEKGENGREERLLDWDWAKKAPWDILILFGGGLSLAQAMDGTGLAAWIGGQLTGAALLGPLVLTGAVVMLIVFLTELTSNTATASAFLPITGALALTAGLAPEALALPAAMAASCAFMLPVATPPNAIVFGSGHIDMHVMMRAGLRLNLIAMAVLTAGAWMLL